MRKSILSVVLAAGALALVPTACDKMNHANPFLEPYDTPYGIPPFDRITYADYEPALEAGIKQQNEQIDSIVNNPAAPDFANTVLALDNSGEILNKVEYVFMALVESDNTSEMHELAEKLSPRFTAHHDNVMLNDSLFARIKAVYDNADSLQLSPVERRLTKKYYDRMVRSGALLTADLKDSLKSINQRQSELSLRFTNNVMVEIADNVIYIADSARLAGLPAQTIADAAALARDKGHAGEWAFTATGSTRLTVLSGADDRELRREMYETYTNTASRGNEHDNSAIINEIIRLRQHKAQLLGFNTFADYAVAPVMAGTVERAENLLMQLWRPAIKKVDEEVADMQAWVDAHDKGFKVEPWDYYYYAEKVKKEKFDLSEDDVRPYFVLDSVVRNGIFYAAHLLYGLNFTEMKDAPKYNPQVTVYDVTDENGEHVAVFMTDYYPRATKAQGAWMSEFNSSYNYKGEVVRPIIYNVASLTPATDDTPSLLTLDEVETVFHEFGHALHGMLTRAPFHSLQGTNVDRDLVEMPSQINEHWALVPEILKNYARHYKTGEVIPQDLVDKIIAAHKFNQGFMTTELVGAALLDIEWHKLSGTTEDIDIRAFEKQVADKLHMPSMVQFRYRSPYFKHIFDNDQYSCGYYTYLWSQVLEADAYERFENEGPLNRRVADDYRRLILEAGDTEDAMTLYKEFRGHEPTAAALLRNRGLD